MFKINKHVCYDSKTYYNGKLCKIVAVIEFDDEIRDALDWLEKEKIDFTILSPNGYRYFYFFNEDDVVKFLLRFT